MPGSRPLWLGVRADGRLLGGLAALATAGRLGRLDSGPDGTAGGPLVRADLPAAEAEAVARTLFEALVGVRGGALRGCGVALNPGHEERWGALLAADPHWRRRSVPAAVLDLEGGPEAVAARLRKSKRNERNRSLRRGCEVGVSTEGEDLAAWHRLHVRAARHWGTQPLALGLLQDLVAQPTGRDGGSAFFTCVKCEGRVIGGHLNLHRGPWVTAWSGVTDPDLARTHFPSTLAVWGDVEEACRRGARWLDLGASSGLATLADFKRTLGAVPRERGWYLAERAPRRLLRRFGGPAPRRRPRPLARRSRAAAMRFFGAALRILLSRVGQVAANAALVVVVAQTLGPVGQGHYSLTMAAAQLASALLACGMGLAAVPPLRQDRVPARRMVTAQAQWSAAMIVLLLAAAWWTCAPAPARFLAANLGWWPGLGFVVAAAAAGLLVYEVFSYDLLARGRLVVGAAVNGWRAFGQLALVAALASVGALGFGRAVGAFAVAQLLGAAALLAVLVREILRPRRTTPMRATAADDALPADLGRRTLRGLILWNLRQGWVGQLSAVAYFLLLRLDQGLVAHFQGAAEVGIYSVAVYAGEILWLLPGAMTPLLIHTSAASAADPTRDRTASRAVRIGFLVTLGAAVPLWLVADPLLALLKDGAYAALGTGPAGAAAGDRGLRPGGGAGGGLHRPGQVPLEHPGLAADLGHQHRLRPVADPAARGDGGGLGQLHRLRLRLGGDGGPLPPGHGPEPAQLPAPPPGLISRPNPLLPPAWELLLRIAFPG